MTPIERIVGDILKENNVKVFKELPDFNNIDEFVLLVNISTDRSFLDYNRRYRTKTYNFILQCFSKGGNGKASLFSDKVSEIIEELYWNDSVEELEISSGADLPDINDHAVRSVGVVLTINK